MRISYRIGTGAALLSFAVSLAIGMLSHKPPQRVTSLTIAWDPCTMMRGQISAAVRVSALLWLGSFLVLIVQGLRNRSVPRWVTAGCTSDLRDGITRQPGSLTSLQQRLMKTGGRLIRHARYYWLLLAESHLTRRLFGSMVRRIEALPVPAG